MATKTISVEQRFELLAKLAANVDWGALDSRVLQQMIDKPGDPGKQLTIFFKSGGKMQFGGLKVAIAPFDPAKFIGEDWKLAADEYDSRNDVLTEIDLGQASFVTCLNKGEVRINGEEKLKRLKAGNQIRYGANAFMGAWNDYQAQKDNSVLEMLYQTQGITYIDFPGDVLLDPSGNRCVLYLYRDDVGYWHWYYDWFAGDWNAKNRSAVSSQFLSAQASVPQVS